LVVIYKLRVIGKKWKTMVNLLAMTSPEYASCASIVKSLSRP
jgi:hypothetical protein